MNEILTKVKNSPCSNCFVGTPFKKLHYDTSGTCLDYVYDKLKVPFAFAWEIYTNEQNFPEMDKYISDNKHKLENNKDNFLKNVNLNLFLMIY